MALDREGLRLLLNSGRFLCFNVKEITEALAAGGESASKRQLLFDNALLNGGIFFKEIEHSEEEDEIVVSTRVYFPFITEEAEMGGQSIRATPERLARFMEKEGHSGPGRAGLSDHDRAVLEVLETTPTFDPFLFLARRAELEIERPVSSAYMDISEQDWLQIRRPVMEKVSQLVRKAAIAAAGGDDKESADAREMQQLMASSVIDAIWRGETSEGTRQLIRGFKLDEERTSEFLFAWKGVSYYEFQFMKRTQLLNGFLRWMASNEMTTPADSQLLQEPHLERMRYRVNTGRTLLKRSYLALSQVLRDYNLAFEELVRADNPKKFREFLEVAPAAFLMIGTAIGMLTHSAVAWRNLTADGSKRVKSANLEPFLDFLVSINGNDVAMPNANAGVRFGAGIGDASPPAPKSPVEVEFVPAG